MSVALVSPRDDLVAAVAARLRPDRKDYSRNWVVFPEKRPGTYLRKALAERERSAFIPPVIASIDGFVDRVYAERLGRDERPLDVLDAVALLFEIHTGAPGRLGRGHFLSADRFFPLGVKLYNDLEEINAAAVRREDLASLDQWAEASIPRETLDRLQSLSFFYERFYEAVRRHGFSTPASRFRAVAEGLRPELFADVENLLFAGFFSLTKTETRLFRTLMSWEKASLLFLKGKGLGTVLKGLGVSDPELFRSL
jgi:ATP-dependent helicase/nuclease subunit B